MPKPNIPGPPPPDMKNMRAYTVMSGLRMNVTPRVVVGKTANDAGAAFYPKSYQAQSHWIAIIDRNDPKKLVAEFTVPGAQNSAVPNGLDQYMTNDKYIFALATSALYSTQVPQGAFFDYLVQHGAGRELRRLEQVNMTLGCGVYSMVSYALTGHCGKQEQGVPHPPAFEAGSVHDHAIIMVSLMPTVAGPPYSICNM